MFWNKARPKKRFHGSKTNLTPIRSKTSMTTLNRATFPNWKGTYLKGGSNNLMIVPKYFSFDPSI